MKNLKFLFLISVLALFLSCNNNTPEAVAKAFTKAQDAQNLDAMKSYSSKNRLKAIDEYLEYLDGDDLFDKEKANQLSKIKIINVTYNSDKTVATVEMELTLKGEKLTDEIDCILEDGEWKIN